MLLHSWDYLHLSQFSLDISESQGKKKESALSKSSFQIAAKSISADSSSAEDLKISTDFPEAQKTSW